MPRGKSPGVVGFSGAGADGDRVCRCRCSGVGHRVVVSELPTKVTQTKDTPRDDPGSFCPARPARCPQVRRCRAVFAELIRAGLQALIEAEATEAIGAGRHQRTDGPHHRNGHRPKTVSTTSGDIEVRSPSCGRVVLPVAAGAAPPDRQGAARGDHGGLRARGVHPKRR